MTTASTAAAAGEVNLALDISSEEEVGEQQQQHPHEHQLQAMDCSTINTKKKKKNTLASSTAGGGGNQHNNKLLYAIDDNPPWHLSFLLGFQHYLMMVGGTISVPFILTPAMCIEETDPVRSSIVSTIIFVSGIVTLLQCTVGVRLPIVQGGTFSFLVPTFAILSLPEWKCPSSEAMSNMTYEDKTELWQLRMREIQGAIIVASLFQVAMGMFGVVGLILRFITPLTIAPAIAMVGISLFGAAGHLAGKHWGFSSLTIVLLILFSQYLRNYKFPFPMYRFCWNTKTTTTSNGGREASAGSTAACINIKRGWTIKRFDIFTLLPVLLSIILVWSLCAILTAVDILPKGSPARTDTKMQILTESPWFRIPYPGQWGLPTVSVAAVFGMLAGVLAGAIESIGDYYACARLAGAKPPPVHAINRGMTIEGLGCLLAGLWGTGNGTTSYSENIGAIGVTKVGSRRVIQAAATMMILFGVLSKFGALFITIPEPIIGGIFCVMFGMIAATGLSNLQFVDLNSSRNLMILGFSIFFSLVMSQWMKENRNAIATGSPSVDQIIGVLLSTSMFTAGVIGFLLDNTIPGSAEERGLTKWQQSHQQPQQQIDEATTTMTTTADVGSPSEIEQNNPPFSISSKNDGHHCDTTYDIPVITPWLKRQRWATYVPFLPSYKERQLNVTAAASCCIKRKNNNKNNVVLTINE